MYTLHSQTNQIFRKQKQEGPKINCSVFVELKLTIKSNENKTQVVAMGRVSDMLS